jgi:hypothetical protein
MRFSARSAFLCLALLVVLIAAAPLGAITYIVPTDAQMIARADGVIIATATESHSTIAKNDRIVTVATLHIDDVLKGSFDSDSIELYEPGGVVGERGVGIPGSPRYQPGTKYLVFLRHTPFGEWATWGMGLGQFRFTKNALGDELVLRGGEDEEIFGFAEKDWTPYVEQIRNAAAFVSFVRDVAHGTENKTDYYVSGDRLVAAFSAARHNTHIAPNFIRRDYLFSGNYRWQNGGTATVRYCCTSKGLQSGLNAVSALSSGCSNWTGGGGSVHYTAGANDESATGGLQDLGRGAADGKNAILFGDPYNDFAASGIPANVAAIGGISSAVGTYSIGDGTNYGNTNEIDVVVAKTLSITQATFNGVITHELGHTLGFRHSNQDGSSANNPCAPPLPCSSSAIMNSSVAANLQTLQQWDRDAVQTVYGNGPVCVPPSISNISGTATISAGASTPLSVTATGTTTFSYQWYTGASGNTSNPVAGGTNAQISVSPTTTTNYWVRVTGQCAPVADSTTVTVTVAPCTAPTISNQPGSISIASGSNTTLSVVAGGSTPFTYQWYIGTSPSTATPTGSNSSTLNVSPSATTPYWVKVTNACGNVNSGTATVTVTCVAPLIVTQPADQTVVTNNTATLSLGHNNSNPSITWYQGTAPDTSTPIGTGRIVTTAPLTQTTRFWAQLSNGCGVVNSRTMTVIVTSTCTAPAITSVTANPATISFGLATTLTVVATGTSLSYQWYVGASGDTASPLNGATNDSVAITATGSSTYWVRVSSGCGAAAVDSPAVLVTVVTCVAPTGLTISGPANIPPGSTATLTASVTGSPTLTYKWFQGSNGDETTPVGTDNLNFVTPPLTTDTLYWVRVGNTCGGADALNFRVVVKAGRRRSANH